MTKDATHVAPKIPTTQDDQLATLAPEAASDSHLIARPLSTYAKAHAHAAYLAAWGLSAKR